MSRRERNIIRAAVRKESEIGALESTGITVRGELRAAGEMSPRRKRLCAADVAVAVVLLVALHFVLVRPYLRHQRIARNERAAVAALRAYLGAQGTFERIDRYGNGKLVYANPKDGTGFPDLYRIGGPLDKPDGTELKLIDLAFARATGPETAKDGYWFVDIVSDEVTGNAYDFTVDCGLCAAPAVYGETGVNTFFINLTGTVYKVDNGGKASTSYPEIPRDPFME